MTSINPVGTQVQAPAFKGLKNGLKQLGKKKLTAEMEQLAGATCAANVKDPAVLKEIIFRETALGNLDFVNGILSSNAAKNIYKK